MKFLATEKKVIRRHMNSCMGCGKNHGERKVDRARELRVERTMRRVRRRESRRVKKQDAVLKDVMFALHFDSKKFIADVNRAAENISRRFKDFFDDVQIRTLGNLEQKTFSGIKNEVGITMDPYVREARFSVLDAQMERQGYRPLPKVTDSPHAD